MGKNIVLVGGGSSGWSPKLLSDLMLTPAIADGTYILHDLNQANLDRIARFGRKLKAKLGVAAAIEAETDPEQALKDADYVLVTISTGGLDAMAHDLAIPEEYSVYHTVGDTMGPGGWARTMRNVPVFEDLARRINRLAPNAVVLNYTNPMAQLTKTLSLCTDRPVVGLCHGLFESLAFAQGILGIENEREIQCTYAGVNHFFWITSLTVRGEDGFRLLREKLAGASLPEYIEARAPGHAHCYLADALWNETGCLTYMADRHICEFFPQFITSQRNLEKYHLVRTTIEQRKENMRRDQANIDQMIDGEIPDYYAKRSRETAADIISAFVTGSDFIDVGNVPNVGQVANLPLGTVLETLVLVTRSGFRPITVGPLDEPMRTWVERCARVEDLSVEAAMSGDLDQALLALSLDPVVSHLDFDQVTELGLRLLRANARYLPQFAGKLGG